LQTGVEISTIHVPGEGEFDYPTTFWTVAFANFIISKYMRLEKIVKVDEKRYWLEYIKMGS